MACDHAQENIRVNAICPGSINTPMVAKLPDEQSSPLRNAHLLGRFAEPMEVAYAALFLASEESSFVTGSVIAVDGQTAK